MKPSTGPASAPAGRVTAADRDVFRKYGAWKAQLPPVSPPPPRTVEQLIEWMDRWCRPTAPLHGDDDEAVERLARMRAKFLARDRGLARERGR